MKKLIAMIGAVAMAFGLYAEGETTEVNKYSTSFEAADTGVDDTEKTWDADEAGWTTEQTEAFTLGEQLPKAQLPYATGRDRRDDLFEGLAVNNNFLKLETGTNTLSHVIGAGQVYFDQLVKFTGYEEDPEIAADAKIAVWLKAVEDDDPATEEVNEIETNLYVTVGTGTGTTKVRVADDFEVDKWYRVTIKSIGDVSTDELTSQLGFQLFIDGQAASIVAADRDYNGNYESFNDKAAALYAKGQLFTAIEMNDLALETVAYKGIGGVDDIIFSQEAPDFDQFVEFTIGAVPGVDVVKVEGPEGVELRVPYSVLPGSQVKIYVKAKDGYRIDNLPEGYITKTISRAGEVSIADELAGKVVKGAVQVVNVATPTVTNIYAEAELGVVLTGLKTDDTATVLENCAIGDDFSFTVGTTIAVPEANVWNVFIANETETAGGSLIDNVGLFAGKTVNVTFDEMIDGDIEKACALFVFGEIGGNITAADNGIVYVNNDSLEGCTLAGTITAANIVVGGDVTFFDSGKIVSETDLNEFEDNLLPVGDVEISYDEETELYTAQIKQTPQGGFMVIIVGQDPLYYETLQDAVDNAPAGATIKALSDAEISARVDIAKALTLDLNGNTITYVAESRYNSGAFGVKFGGDLTITDSSEDADGVIDATMCYAAVSMTTKGEVYDGTPAKLTVEAGTLRGYYYAITGSGNAGRDHTEIVINGGTIMGLAVNDSAGIYAPQAGTIVVNDGTITGATGIYAKSGSLTVNGGTIAAVGASATPTYNGNGFESTGDAIILDGAGESYAGDMTLVLDDDAVLTSANSYGVREVVTKGDTQTLSITDRGATITAELGGLSVSDKFVAKVAAGGATVTGYVASVNGLCYKTLADAIDAAVAGNTVTLVANCEVTSLITVAKAITIDLNAKTIAAKSATGVFKFTAAASGFELKNGAINSGLEAYAAEELIEIIDAAGNLTDLAINSANYQYGVVATTDGNKDIMLTPFTGKIVCDGVSVTGGRSCLFYTDYIPMDLIDCTAIQAGDIDHPDWYNCAVSAAWGATVTVKSGTYSAKYVLNEMSSPAKIVVEGGKFTGTVKDWGLDAVNYGDYGTHEWEIAAGDFSDKTIPTAFIKPVEHMVAKWVASTIPDYVTPGYEWEKVKAIWVVDTVATTNLVNYNTVPVKPEDPVKTGYEFKGWDKDTTVAITEDTTYTAQFTANTYYVQTFTNGVEYVQEAYTFGDDEITLTEPDLASDEEWDGKWYTTADGDTEWKFDGSVAGNTQKAYAKITKKAEEPVKPGDVKTAKTIEEAQAMQIQAADAAAEAAGQLAVLKKTITENPAGGYTVKVDIKTDAPEYKAPEVAVTELATDLSDIAAGESITLDLSDATKFTPGLYYSVDTALELGATADFVEGARVLAGPEGATLTVTKPQGATTKAFFKVSEHMTATPPNTED